MLLLTVIIPARNRHSELAELLSDLLSQSESASLKLEIIVVDDASQPPISVPTDTAFGQITLVRLEQRAGAQISRRKGLALAGGDIVHFHDSDDLLVDGWLQKVIRAFSSNADLDVLITSRLRQSSPNGPFTEINPHIAVELCKYPRWFCHYQRFRNAIGPIGGVTFRRSVLKETDLVDSPASQDWLLYDVVLARYPKCAVRHDIKFVYRAIDDMRINASPRRRVKGFIVAAARRFRSDWAARLAAIIYCAHAGSALHDVVHVRHCWFWSFVGNRVASSRILARFTRT